MAAVSLFWDTNMAAMTSCENTLFESFSFFHTETQGMRFVMYDIIIFLRVKPRANGRNIVVQQLQDKLKFHLWRLEMVRRGLWVNSVAILSDQNDHAMLNISVMRRPIVFLSCLYSEELFLKRWSF